MNKIHKCGQWYWREGEIKYAEFEKLKKEEKEAHVKFLQTLDHLGSNDKAILLTMRAKEKQANKFLEL